VRVHEPPDELAELCRVEWPRLVGTFTLLTGDRAVAEELAQEALARACARWERVRKLESPGGWLHRVAVNLAISHERRRRVARRAEPRLVVSDVGAPDDADAIALRDALRQLPDKQRQVLVLRYFADLGVAEVGAMLRMPEGTVKTLTHRGIAALRDMGLVGDDAVIEVSDVS
jgi:RNA polymerase sigma-70 factor (ECF subfamily)